MILSKRPRRNRKSDTIRAWAEGNRKSDTIRAWAEETTISTKHLIFPLFLTEGEKKKEIIPSMPDIFRFSTDNLLKEIEECCKLGINAFALFPHLEESQKDKFASQSWNENGLYLQTIRLVKKYFPQICLLTDVAMDPYSSDGHDGLVENGKILNDETLEILGKMALAQAQAGSDIIAPSDMMDGRVAYIRQLLDNQNFTDVSIMAYTAKYASSFYAPFRDALDSAPKFGDKKTYQMNPANVKEAIIEAELDEAEGADFLMVKPALAYLDVIKTLRETSNLPIAAYNVSGEYAMVKAAAAQGWLDSQKTMYECLLSMRRAGANVILTYFAKEFAQYEQK
ncbi:MAG: porphobilinogen synthase [Bacteroidetes bacterium]|nr:MAG: porphobilinogen synthase [Bacteroidota bacterium]